MPGLPRVRAMARVTKSYVTRGGAVSAIASALHHGAVYHLREVGDRRLRVQVREHVVAARVTGERRDPRATVAQVAEHDGLRRTRLCARWRDVAVLDVAIFETGPVLRAADPLHAERALLHHALFAHRDVRVEQHVERIGPALPLAAGLGIVVPVEVADLVRAVVGAIASPDAAVVDLAVQAVGRMIRRVHRADRLTRGVAALLAQHRCDDRTSGSARLPTGV